MSIDSFLTFFNGIYADYDGAYGDQCFDLANLYSHWIGGQRFTGATADLIFNQPGDFYVQIPNTLDYVPQKGDIVIWNWPHVGIATGNNSDVNQFEVLEQNDPGGSNCHIKIYENYNGVIGALRPKQLPQDDSQSVVDDLRTARDNNWNLYQTALKQIDQDKTEIESLSAQLDTCKQEVTTTQTSTEVPLTLSTTGQSTVVNVSTQPEVVPNDPTVTITPPVEAKPLPETTPTQATWRLSDLIVWMLKNIIRIQWKGGK